MSIRTTVTNTNDSGAGSLRATVDAGTTTPKLVTFSAGGTIPISGTAQLVVDEPNTRIDGGANTVVVASNSAFNSSYSVLARSHGLTLKNLHFDNTASGGNGCGVLFALASASSTTQYPSALVRNCYFRNGTIDEDNAWIGQLYRRIIFEYCIFDGTGASGGKSAVVGYTDNVGPGTEMAIEVIFKHCIFLGKGRIPDLTLGTTHILGCTIQRIHGSGLIRGYARANLVNNWYLNPSDTGVGNNPGSALVTKTDTPVNGQNLRAGSIYSSGNYQDGVAESAWVSRDYANSFYTDYNVATAAASTYFRSTPWGNPPSVPDAIESRRITLARAGPAARSANAAAAVAKVIGRRPLDTL